MDPADSTYASQPREKSIKAEKIGEVRQQRAEMPVLTAKEVFRTGKRGDIGKPERPVSWLEDSARFQSRPQERRRR